MKFFNKILIIVFVPFTFVWPQCTSTLSVETDNAGAKIYLNDSLAGTGSLQAEITEGNYSLLVLKDSLSWNPVSFRDTFIVTGCNDNKDFNYTFRQGIYLETDPADTYVYSSDSLLGFTPLYVSQDIVNLRLSKPGYEDKNIGLNDIESGKVISLNYTGEEASELFIKRDWFKVLIGTAIILGGVTSYYKLRADKSFEDYQFTGDPDELRKTRHYDLISGVTFGALQVNFGLLIYFLLTD